MNGGLELLVMIIRKLSSLRNKNFENIELSADLGYLIESSERKSGLSHAQSQISLANVSQHDQHRLETFRLVVPFAVVGCIQQFLRL